MKNKLLVVVIIAFAVLIIGGCFYFMQKGPGKELPTTTTLSPEVLIQKSIEGFNPLTNPLEDKPNLNPVEKANPMKDLKLNPFE